MPRLGRNKENWGDAGAALSADATAFFFSLLVGNYTPTNTEGSLETQDDVRPRLHLAVVPEPHALIAQGRPTRTGETRQIMSVTRMRGHLGRHRGERDR